MAQFGISLFYTLGCCVSHTFDPVPFCALFGYGLTYFFICVVLRKMLDFTKKFETCNVLPTGALAMYLDLHEGPTNTLMYAGVLKQKDHVKMHCIWNNLLILVLVFDHLSNLSFGGFRHNSEFFMFRCIAYRTICLFGYDILVKFKICPLEV
jgi:hypothetical protein